MSPFENRSEDLARHSARQALLMVHRAKVSHIGSSLSCIDILTVLYLHMLRKDNPAERDIVLISKGHAAAGVYAVMANLNLLDRHLLDSYCLDGGELGGHVTARENIELSTGSLGHALPFANGRALVLKRVKSERKVLVLLSDGECDEGSNWEAALFASHHKLNNVKVLIDRNHLQSLKSTEETLALEPFADKWKSFGWDVVTVNGHNHDDLNQFLNADYKRPAVAICETTKGHGVSFMRNSVAWHYKAPNDVELNMALSELDSHA